MTDVLIRDLPDDVVQALDAQARRLRLSRAEYLRRQMMRAAAGSAEPVTVEALDAFSTTFADLADPEVMSQAWR